MVVDVLRQITVRRVLLPPDRKIAQKFTITLKKCTRHAWERQLIQLAFIVLL